MSSFKEDEFGEGNEGHGIGVRCGAGGEGGFAVGIDSDSRYVLTERSEDE